MNLKKLGIVLFLCICLTGFCLSSVSAEKVYHRTTNTLEVNKLYIEADIKKANNDKNTAWNYGYIIDDLVNKGYIKKVYDVSGRLPSGTGKTATDKDGYVILKPTNGTYTHDFVVGGGVEHHYVYNWIISDTGLPANNVIDYRVNPGTTMTSFFTQKIISTKSDYAFIHSNFDNKKFKIVVTKNYDFGRSDINSAFNNVTYTLEDGSIEIKQINVIR
jgi:hypothetical protein